MLYTLNNNTLFLSAFSKISYFPVQGIDLNYFN